MLALTLTLSFYFCKNAVKTMITDFLNFITILYRIASNSDRNWTKSLIEGFY